MSSIMKKEIDLQISDNETNACRRSRNRNRNRNHNRNAVTAPSAGAQVMQRSGKAPAASTTPILSKELMKLKYSKVNLQPVTPLSSPLPSPLLPSSSVVPSPLLPSSSVVPAPLPPPPKPKAYVPILPRPQTTLRINSIAAENNIRQLGPADMTLSRSYDLGNGPNCPFRLTSSQAYGRGGSGLNRPLGLTSSSWLYGEGSELNRPLGLTSNSWSYGEGSGLTHPFGIGSSQSSYDWGRSGAVQPNWLTLSSSFSRAGNGAARQLGGAILSPRSVTNNHRYHPYMMRDMDLPYVANERSDSTMRTIDFLSQMEERSTEQIQGRRVLNTPHEMLVDWGSMLTLGNGRRRSVDLSLRIRLG